MEIHPFLAEQKQKLLRGETITLHLKITPKSGKREISSVLSDGTIKIKLKSTPEKNKANQELIEFLSEYFEVPEKFIKIKNGQSASRKNVQIGR